MCPCSQKIEPTSKPHENKGFTLAHSMSLRRRSEASARIDAAATQPAFGGCVIKSCVFRSIPNNDRNLGLRRVLRYPSYPKTHLTMKTSPRQTLSSNVPENLIRVARRHAAGRGLCRAGFEPYPISGCDRCVGILYAMFRLRHGFGKERWMARQRLAVHELVELSFRESGRYGLCVSLGAARLVNLVERAFQAMKFEWFNR